MTAEGLQVLGELHLLTGYWFFDIHHKENKVGLMNGRYGLFEDFLLELVAC